MSGSGSGAAECVLEEKQASIRNEIGTPTKKYAEWNRYWHLAGGQDYCTDIPISIFASEKKPKASSYN